MNFMVGYVVFALMASSSAGYREAWKLSETESESFI